MNALISLRLACYAACTAVVLASGPVAAEDADTREVQNYVLTKAALAKYTQATQKLTALPGACSDGEGEDDTSGNASLSAMAAKLDATPDARSAVQSAGMTTREYVVFSMALLHNGLASWAADQPGGKLPPGTSKANVDFMKTHASELEKLSALDEQRCAGDDGAEEEEEEGEGAATGAGADE